MGRIPAGGAGGRAYGVLAYPLEAGGQVVGVL